MPGAPVFDFTAFVAAVDAEREHRGLGWYEVAHEVWEQSEQLNAERDDHPLCGGALGRLGRRGATSCQYALFLLRWLRRPPEDFLVGPPRQAGDTDLPPAGPDTRLRWNLALLHDALDQERRERGLTWAQLGQELGCTPGRLTNLRTARMADLELTMRITQWLRRPAADFIHPATW